MQRWFLFFLLFFVSTASAAAEDLRWVTHYVLDKHPATAGIKFDDIAKDSDGKPAAGKLTATIDGTPVLLRAKSRAQQNPQNNEGKADLLILTLEAGDDYLEIHSDRNCPGTPKIFYRGKNLSELIQDDYTFEGCFGSMNQLGNEERNKIIRTNRRLSFVDSFNRNSKMFTFFYFHGLAVLLFTDEESRGREIERLIMDGLDLHFNPALELITLETDEVSGKGVKLDDAFAADFLGIKERTHQPLLAEDFYQRLSQINNHLENSPWLARAQWENVDESQEQAFFQNAPGKDLWIKTPNIHIRQYSPNNTYAALELITTDNIIQISHQTADLVTKIFDRFPASKDPKPFEKPAREFAFDPKKPLLLGKRTFSMRLLKRGENDVRGDKGMGVTIISTTTAELDLEIHLGTTIIMIDYEKSERGFYIRMMRIFPSFEINSLGAIDIDLQASEKGLTSDAVSLEFGR